MDHLLDIEDLGSILSKLKLVPKANGKWQDFGLGLGLSYTTIENIEADEKGVESCFRACLAGWLRRADNVDEKGVPTWLRLAEVLEEIGDKATAEKIRKGKVLPSKQAARPLPMTSKKTHIYEPLSRAVKIPRTEAGYRVTDGNIAAIDFGTSVSLAYATRGDKEVSTFILASKDQSARVPNAVLLKKGPGKVKVEGFGNIAREKFASLRRPSDHKEFIYFERDKMSVMKRDELIDRQSLVESFSGEKFYLIEVIAFILKYLKDKLIDHFSYTVRPLKTTDFDWVITVPAIWDARGKRMMREAAYMAGLLTEFAGITQFSLISGAPLPLPKEFNPDKLTLALEPESAAFYSQEMVRDQIESIPAAAIGRPTNYMVIYIGGGTVDITVHVEVDDGIVVDNIPTGIAWGSTQVNEAFSQLLQKLVRDPGYQELRNETGSDQMSVVNKILYDEFDNQKWMFGQGQTEEIVVSLPIKFVKYYDEVISAEAEKTRGIYYDNDTIYISKSVVESQLFGPTLEGIVDCAMQAIEENGSKVNTFYLVGGFSGCKYVHEKVSAAIKGERGSRCNVIVPIAPQFAVSKGAVMWRKNPERIKARRSDATYGIGTTLPFDPQIHDEHYRYYDSDYGQYRCDNVFAVFLKKGELISASEVHTITIRPKSKFLSIIIFATPNLGVYYTVDKNGKSTVTKMGRLLIDIPNEEHKVDIIMDFSGTEIQAKAKYHVTGEEFKIVCDFLSAQ